jgi:hypothetical protein
VHAHEKGIVHRDIKPHNILIDSYVSPKLTDFGIARALNTTQATRTGSYLGTASYSSPEQLRGGVITPKSDVYSLGCTLYQAAVGEPPYSGSPIEVASQQLTKSPTPPRLRGAALSEPLEALILASLAKDPANRPDAAGLQEQLLRISAVASGAVPIKTRAPQTTRSLAGVGGIVNAAGTAKAAGTKGLETIVQGLKERIGPVGASGHTLVSPARDSRPRWPRRRTAFAVGIVTLLLLVLVAVTGVPTLLNDKKANQTTEGVQDTAKPSAETAAGEFTPAASEPPPPLDTAEKAVFDMYIQASYRNFDAAWAYLSQRKQSEEGSKERWAERQKFNDLWYVDFPQMPKARALGDEARVAFELEETHSADVRRTTGTWVGVNEGGEWKLDRLEVEGTETLN